MTKRRKPLSYAEQFKKLCDSLAQDAMNDKAPLTGAERAEADRLRTELEQFAENHAARLKAERGGKKKASYIN